jgi:hypothetical protein
MVVTRFLVALALVAASNCRSPVQRGESAGTASPADGQVTFRVVNRNKLDIVVFVVHGGTRDRIGQSTASTTTPFTYALRRLGAGREYYLLGDPVGSLGVTVRSENLTASNGQLVIWTLEHDLQRSTVEVR